MTTAPRKLPQSVPRVTDRESDIMSDPVLIEVLRGTRVESRHRGAVAVVDAGGAHVLMLGDVARPVFPRSAVKALQALVLVESGAADRYGFGEEELALACASHGGEPGHVATAERMLERCDLDPRALACGAHWPSHQPSAQALMRAGTNPTALHNNCSGKHAGFLAVACAMGVDHRGYTDPEHPVQRDVRAVIETLAGVRLEPDAAAIDGCSVPTWAVPLERLALAFARLGTGQGLGPERASAAARLRSACAAKPWHVAGSGKLVTEVMERLGVRAFLKNGAEGVMCAALPEAGLRIAIKCEDGASRASDAVAAALIASLLRLEPEDRAVLEALAHPVLHNWNGISVGALRPTVALTAGPAGK
jgi:L-asparaginase II